MFSFGIVVLVAVASTEAFLLNDLLRKEKWDGLKVTWGPNPLSSSYFVTMPRTVQEATSQGFHKIQDCDMTAAWRGNRYIKGDDYAVILLFDVNGYIAGIQTSFKDNQSNGFPSAKLRPPFVPDGDRLTISAYFVDPAIICAAGRSDADFAAQGTGTNLYIQKTAKPEESTMIPHKETGMPATKWTEGKCFVTMGKHYWYDLSKDMSCDDYFPAFLLYNAGELTAFGWALITDLTSPRFEHPTKTVFPLFMKDPPTCLMNAATISTMHIYLTSSAASDLC